MPLARKTKVATVAADHDGSDNEQQNGRRTTHANSDNDENFSDTQGIDADLSDGYDSDQASGESTFVINKPKLAKTSQIPNAATSGSRRTNETSPSSAADKVLKSPKKITNIPQLVYDTIKSVGDDKKGASVQIIKKHIKEAISADKNWNRVNLSIKNALVKGIESGKLVRPKGSKAVPTSYIGSFLLAKESSEKTASKAKNDAKKTVEKSAMVKKVDKSTVAKKAKSRSTAVVKPTGKKSRMSYTSDTEVTDVAKAHRRRMSMKLHASDSELPKEDSEEIQHHKTVRRTKKVLQQVSATAKPSTSARNVKTRQK